MTPWLWSQLYSTLWIVPFSLGLRSIHQIIWTALNVMGRPWDSLILEFLLALHALDSFCLGGGEGGGNYRALLGFDPGQHNCRGDRLCLGGQGPGSRAGQANRFSGITIPDDPGDFFKLLLPANFFPV